MTCTADGDTVEVLEGASVLGTGTCSGGTVAITLTSPLSEGGHLIFSHETDAAGNTSGDSGNLSLTIDTTAPGTPGAPDLQAASDSGSSSTDNVTNDTTPTFDGTCASDGDTVELVTGTTVLGSSTCSGGTVTITSSVLANGVQVVFLRETDTSGNTSSNSSTLSVTIDASTPALTGPPDLVAGSDTGASAADNVTGDNTPTFILTCETGTSVVLFDGVTSVGTSTCAGGTVSITASVLSDGSHSITAKQTDLAGNTSNGSAVLGVTIDTAAPAAPSITAPTNGSTVESNAPAISGSGEIGGTVSIFDGATLLGTATVNGSGAWTFTPSPDLADGSHSLTATETDLAGNTSASSGAISFIIDAGAFISSPGFIKWNTFLKQWNFLELVASGSGGFNVTIDIYNLNSVKIFSDTVFLGGNSEYDYDINNAIFTACASATPPAGCTGLTDVDGDGLLDSYGTIVLRFTPPTGSHLVGRMTNYRPDTNANSFSFAFPRELRKTSKGKTFAVANTYDPQNSGFLVPNFGELIHIGEAQAAATGGVVAGGRYTVNIYDQVGTLVNTQRIPADNSPAIQALGEVDFAAGHQIVNPQTGQPIEAVYLVEVVPDDLNAEYLFSVARYSSNAPAGTVPTSYNYALAVAGRAPATDVLYAPITNETFSCGIPQTWVEVANTSGTAQTANVTFRNSAGTVVGTATGTSFPAKGQIHFNGTGVLTAGDIGSVSVQSTNPGTFIVQSMNYIHSCNENLIDSAYVSLGRTVGRQVQLGTVNTFLAMTDTIRSISTVGSSNTLGMTFKPFGGSAITTSRPIAAFGSDSLVINSLGFPSDQYGSAQVDGGATHTFLADILRSRTQTRGGQSHVDFIVPSEVR